MLHILIRARKLVDESFGSAKALRDVWRSHVRTVHNIHVIHSVAHSFSTLFGFSPTSSARPTTIFKLFFFPHGKIAKLARLLKPRFCAIKKRLAKKREINDRKNNLVRKYTKSQKTRKILALS